MGDCELLGSCGFPHGTAENGGIERRYCRGNNESCARYMTFCKKGRPALPPDLDPRNVERALEIIAGLVAELESDK